MTSSPQRLLPSDLYRFALATMPAISPDGTTLVYAQLTFDREKEAKRTALWRIDANGHVPFTAGTNDRAAVFAPDGERIAFVRDVEEKPAIFTMSLRGGEPRELVRGYDKIGSLAWSPDGTHIAFTATAPHDPQTANVYVDEKSQARHIRALPFKSDDDGLLDGIRKHLFVVATGGGAAVQLTRGNFDVSGPAWSPDGTTLAYASQADKPEDATALGDIFAVDVATHAVRKLTATNGPAQAPAFSPDGTEIAYVGHTRGDDGGGALDYALLAVPAGGGAIRSLSAGYERTVGDQIMSDTRPAPGACAPRWSADGSEVFTLVSVDGATSIAAFPRAGGAPRIVASGERAIFGFDLARDGTVAFAYSTPVIPADIATLDPHGTETRRTALNDGWLAAFDVLAPTRLRPRSADGTVDLDLWMLVPAAAEPLPLILEVHGGPHGAYGFAFFFEFQLLASHGFAVAYGNPRGSQSYGEAYASAIAGDWGGCDVADVLTLLDAAEAAGNFDRARIGVAGGSYGGFMTTTLLGRSNRFAAGVSMRAVNDFVSEVGASDVGWFLERELKAPWFADQGRALFEGSPMRTAHQIVAPLLIEHSERDFRCPIDQGEQLFTLLRRLHRTVEFVRFTGDGHNLSRTGSPRNRILRLRAILHWFIRHLRPANSTPAADAAGALFSPLPGEQD